MRLRDRFRLITEWRTVLFRSMSNWVATIVGFLVGALANTYLAAFAVIGFIPHPWLQLPLAGLVGAIVIGGPIVLARIVRQPVMEAKIEQKTEEKAEAKADEKIIEAYHAANP